MRRASDGAKRDSVRRFGWPLALVLAACGGTVRPTENDGGSFPDAPSGNVTTVPATDAADAFAGTLDSGAAGPPPNDSLCFENAHLGCIDCCVQCCGKDHMAGILDHVALVKSCVCGAGPCAEPCSYELCIGTVPVIGDVCDKCVNAALAGPCGGPVEAGCAADPDCTAFEACSDQCVIPLPDAGEEDAGIPDSGCASACEDADAADPWDVDAWVVPPACMQGAP
ncbi:MAG TPA: hypothetical protein VHS09_07230, partial [Polyangiaceae bacterium]|nr:hypothetical protein [Polyangiaceae bacterium]